jgi:hypothetical protein
MRVRRLRPPDGPQFQIGVKPSGASRASHPAFAASGSSCVAAHCSGVKSNGEVRCSIGTITPQPGRTQVARVARRGVDAVVVLR